MLECLKTFFQWLIPSEQQCQHTGDWWHHHCWPIEPGRSSYSWREDSHLVEESQAFSTVKKRCFFFKWVSNSWLWYGHFFSHIMMLNLLHLILFAIYFEIQVLRFLILKCRYWKLKKWIWSITCVSMTIRATAVWLTLVLSRQSTQLTLNTPLCSQIVSSLLNLVKEKITV